MNPTFINFHQNRFEWAFKAKQEFINRFVRLDVNKSEVSSAKELTIAVYGPTQVGKTTVILSLLGIKQNKLEQLSKWLRGKRKLGESSTVTVMRYEQSHDDYFHVRFPNDEVKDGLKGDQFENVLREIRENVETQESYSVKPVVLEIPANYFEERTVHLNIVDLPGVESAELNEVEHVKQCIKHWLPLSEVCLLVDDAAQLTAFTQYENKEIRKWFEQLENFRVIPTRALSLDNIRKDIFKGNITSAADLVGDYGKVLNRVLKMDLDLTKTIYPIDVGNSWNVICEKEPVLYEKIKGIMNEILLNLQKDLENLDVNELSFNRLTKLYKEAEESSKLELEQHENEVKKYNRLIERQKAILNHVKEEGERQYNQICEEIQVFNTFISTIELKDTHFEIINKIVNDSIEYTPDFRRSSVINTCIAELEQSIEEELESNLRKVIQEATILKIGTGIPVRLPFLSSIPRIEQMIDSFWLTSTYEKAVSKTCSHAYKWVRQMYHNYNQVLTPILNEAIEVKGRLLKDAAVLKKANERGINQLEEELALYQEIKANLDAHYQQVLELWEQDREHASKLQSYFIKHWLEYKNELQLHLHYGNTEERWFASQYLQLLHRDGAKIIESLT